MFGLATKGVEAELRQHQSVEQNTFSDRHLFEKGDGELSL